MNLILGSVLFSPDGIFSSTESIVWEHPAREVWVSRQGLGSHHRGSQRPHFKAAGSRCNTAPQCCTSPWALVGAGGENLYICGLKTVELSAFILQHFKSMKTGLLSFWWIEYFPFFPECPRERSSNSSCPTKVQQNINASNLINTEMITQS